MHIYISAENHACMAMDARVYPYMCIHVYIYIAIERIFIITTYVYLGTCWYFIGMHVNHLTRSDVIMHGVVHPIVQWDILAPTRPGPRSTYRS